MTMTTFLQRQMIWTLNSNRNNLCYIRLTTITSLYYDNYYGFAAANRKSSSSSTSSYSSMFNLLEQYKEREGDCDVPRNHKEDGKNLGEWLSTRRMDKKKGRLDAEKEKEMEERGVVWDIYSKQWQDFFTLLVQYKKKVGNCNVPRDHKEDEKNLGSWLNTQRLDKKKGRLDAKRESGLDEIGVVWDVLSQKWETMFALLLQYNNREGDCNVPSRHIEDGTNLGWWLKKQRADKKRGTLDIVKEKQLEDVGIVWNVYEHEWDRTINILMQYKNREGDCNVPYDHEEDGKKLGWWLSNKRQDKKRGILDTIKEKQLEELGIVWDVLEYGWDEFSKLLIQYKNREGDCNVPRDHKEDGKNLGDWFSRQNYGKLSEVRQERLREIGVIWDNPRIRTK